MGNDEQWLDADEAAAWLSLSTLLVVLPPVLDSRMQAVAELTHFEYLVLSRLSEVPGRSMRISELAAFSHGSLSRMSHLVKRLEGRGWVRRETCADDARSTEAVLTDEGYAKVVETAPHHLAAVRDLVISRLTRTQLHQLHTVAGRLTEGVTPHR
ncbi:MarR family winged helix-turn-helix transcriptional regulator [Amycolatopsis pithecellobii]|uniref:MarR family winged helix-turn-helix transcriptional regulator n=1 Tax=Amycolatopsis pithecellobii TaxID=664692 RepID=UPI0028AB5DF2|nr:MarR family transcriptional regulator [Amycolatopsis pithecellobii]